MQSNINFDLSYFDIADQVLFDKLIQFLKSYEDDCVGTQLHFHVHSSFSQLIESICAAYRAAKQSPRVICYDARTAAVISDQAFVAVNDENDRNFDLWTTYDRSIVVNGYGDNDVLSHIGIYLRLHIQETKMPTLRWEFLAGNERHSQNIKIKPAKPIYPEFYPWIGDVYSYFDRYLNSESSILVLLGETGTAKTSFIRNMIWHASLNAMLTYEEELLSADSLFVDFMVDDDIDLLVIEDADMFLTSREHDGNRIMSKFLNVSDGLAAINNKKMIFTANITEPARIDNALLRAGRCFDCQMFRRLSYAETCAAAGVAGIKPPPKVQSYTLAEMFAHSRQEHSFIIQTKFGFNP